MKIYTTLENEKYDCQQLPPEHKVFLKKVTKYYTEEPLWDEFSYFWLSKGSELWREIKGEELVELPIYKICQDMEVRLGIKQGYTRERDYRDDLEEMIAADFRSNYKFCQLTGIDQGFLSNVIKKRKNFSITKLEKVLHKVGYRLSIQKESVH